jgi:hypothetical protein
MVIFRKHIKSSSKQKNHENRFFGLPMINLELEQQFKRIHLSLKFNFRKQKIKKRQVKVYQIMKMINQF